MMPVYKKLIVGFHLTDDKEDAFNALKWCQWLYYHIEPAQIPKPSIEERLATLYNLIRTVVEVHGMKGVSSHTLTPLLLHSL
jgi:hypothetical protein